MKGITRFIVGALVFAALGCFCLGASRLDAEMAKAQETMLTSDYGAADASLSAAEHYYQYISRVPWVGEGPLHDVRARQAALKYWQRQYAALAPPDRTDPVTDVPTENVPLQFIVAGAVYRAAQSRVNDRATALAALDSTINAYRAVLSNARRVEDAPYAERAAYNYEYAVRSRDEIRKGVRRGMPPPDEDGNLGRQGETERPLFKPEFKQYVPLEKDERDKPTAGQFAPPSRKG